MWFCDLVVTSSLNSVKLEVLDSKDVESARLVQPTKELEEQLNVQAVEEEQQKTNAVESGQLQDIVQTEEPESKDAESARLVSASGSLFQKDSMDTNLINVLTDLKSDFNLS